MVLELSLENLSSATRNNIIGVIFLIVSGVCVCMCARAIFRSWRTSKNTLRGRSRVCISLGQGVLARLQANLLLAQFSLVRPLSASRGHFSRVLWEATRPPVRPLSASKGHFSRVLWEATRPPGLTLQLGCLLPKLSNGMDAANFRDSGGRGQELNAPSHDDTAFLEASCLGLLRN